MSADSEIPQLEIIHAMDRVDRADWNRLAQPEGAPYDPFLDWDFLSALEQSGSVNADTGWLPHHLILYDDKGVLAAAMPLYLKLHSQGEFVFDHGWAEALTRAGGQYYPKFLSAVPFTPVTGRRLLVGPCPDPQARAETLLKTLISLTCEHDLSSCHVNFIQDEDAQFLEEQGFLLREDQQFHWHNRGYADFDAFLADLTSRKRKSLKKERARAQHGLVFEHLSGAQLQQQHWDAFFTFYLDTGVRKWGSPYLNREFFVLLHERMADRVLLILARDGDEYIAGALNLIGSETLYGRYWGCTQTRDCLHFETCYYQAIDFAIAQGLKRVEAGAQGHHKLARGYEPVTTRSAHWITHPGLREAVAAYLQEEKHVVRSQNTRLNACTPFAKNKETPPI